MKQKILSFITDNEKFLTVYNKPHKEHGKGGWFVVTGGLEKGETHEQAVKREIKEETNLDAEKIIDLDWKSVYNWNNEECEEKNFLSFVKPNSEIKLNEEHSDYKWLELDEFIKIIEWDDDKEMLKKILEKFLNKINKSNN